MEAQFWRRTQTRGTLGAILPDSIRRLCPGHSLSTARFLAALLSAWERPHSLPRKARLPPWVTAPGAGDGAGGMAAARLWLPPLLEYPRTSMRVGKGATDCPDLVTFLEEASITPSPSSPWPGEGCFRRPGSPVQRRLALSSPCGQAQRPAREGFLVPPATTRLPKLPLGEFDSICSWAVGFGSGTDMVAALRCFFHSVRFESVAPRRLLQILHLSQEREPCDFGVNFPSRGVRPGKELFQRLHQKEFLFRECSHGSKAPFPSPAPCCPRNSAVLAVGMGLVSLARRLASASEVLSPHHPWPIS